MREMQCRSGGKADMVKNSGNRAGLLQQIKNKCGGKMEKWQKSPQNTKNTHTMNLE